MLRGIIIFSFSYTSISVYFFTFSYKRRINIQIKTGNSHKVGYKKEREYRKTKLEKQTPFTAVIRVWGKWKTLNK